ncbi:MAG: SprB repeat-containing protein, partial [Sphingobacteriales bacterium]|nr:SprB repeat-containing protein [Sphingobacteriales bacterium]
TSPNFAQAQSTLQYTDEFVQLDSIIWSTNAAFTNRINLATYTATYTGNTCQATDTLYCALICKDTTAAPIAAGYLALQINPSTYNNALVSTSTLPCQVPTITSTCIAYTLTPISVPTTVNAGDSGTATWQVTNGCFVDTVGVNYACASNPYISCLQEAQPTIEWQKSLGGSNNDYGYSAKQTPDGGYIVAGTAASTNFNVTGNHGGNDYWVVKLNAAGSIVWQKTYGGADDDDAKDIQLTPDGGYIVAGNTYSTNGDITLNNGQNDYWVVKLDSNGNIVWQKTLGGESYDYAESITLTNDGGYAIAGYSFSVGGNVTGNHGLFDYWIVKLDSNGNLVWQNALGGTDVEEAYSIRLTTDNGFIVAGSTYSPNSGDVTGNHGTNTRDYWIVKLNANGSLVWQKALGGTISDAAYDVQQTTDGGYIVAGYAQSNNGDVTNNHGSLDYWIVKLDSNGNLIWQKALGGSSSDWAYSIAQTTDGGFVVTGYTSSNNGDVSGNNGAFDYSTMKLDANGNLVWQKSLGSTDDDTAFDVLQTTDGGYLLTGSAGANGGNVTGNHGFNDYWIVKLAAPELVTPTCEAQTSAPIIINNAPYCTDSTLYVGAASYNTDFCYGQTYLLCTATPDSSILAQNTTGIFNLAALGITAGNYVVVALNYFHATLQADTLSSLNQLATLCANYQSISITVQACTPCSNPLTPNITGNTTICQGSSTTLNAGAGYATYLWNNGATTQTINALTFGNYAVVVTDANGCTGNTQVSVTIASSIIVNATSTNGSCSGNNGTATVTANGSSNYTYLWSNSQTTQTINNLSAGTYTVTVTSGICNATASVILVTPPPVNASATSTNPLCNGGANGTVSVTASGGTPAYTYAWSNGQNSANANGLASGSYTVTVTDSQGCSTTTNVTLTQPTPVTASATGTNPLCNGATNGSATVTASGGTPAGYTYAWSNGQTAITATNLAAGTYTVTVTDSQGCSKTTTVTVIQPTNLTASATGVNPSCNGDTSGSAVATASGGTPPLTYLWNNGQATAAATNLAAGNYWVTVTDGNGCTATASVVISSNNITPTITGNTTICGGNSTTLTASGGGTGATYNWSNIAGANNPVNNIVSPTTNTTYTVTVTNTNGCTGIASATINVQAAPIVSLTTTDTTLCTASTINLSALLSNNSNTNGSWVGTGVFGNLFDASQVTAGTYQILYIVMPSGACGMVSDTLYIHVGTPLTPNITGSLSFCQGSSTTLNAGAGYAGYIWSNTTTNQTITVNNAGTYTVTVSSVNGCTATASTTVTVNANPNPSISGSSTFCTGTSTTLTANGGGTYAWTASNGGVISAANTASITVNTTGTYTVVVTNNGCTDHKQAVRSRRLSS